MCLVAGPLRPVAVPRPQLPTWRPSVCGPGGGHLSLGGSPLGLKLDAIRPGHARGQKLRGSWPESRCWPESRWVSWAFRGSHCPPGPQPTGGGVWPSWLREGGFKGQEVHEAEKVPQECVPAAAQPSRPRSGRPRAGRPAALSAARVWSDGGAPPQKPPVSGRATQAPSWALERPTNSPELWKRLRLSESGRHRAWTETDPGGDLREQGCSLCAGSLQDTPAAGKLAHRWCVCLVGQSREPSLRGACPAEPPGPAVPAGSGARGQEGLPSPPHGSLPAGSGSSLSRQGCLAGCRELGRDAQDRAPLHKPPWGRCTGSALESASESGSLENGNGQLLLACAGHLLPYPLGSSQQAMC